VTICVFRYTYSYGTIHVPMNSGGLYASFLLFPFIHSIHGLVFCSSATKATTSILILFVTVMKVSVTSGLDVFDQQSVAEDVIHVVCKDVEVVCERCLGYQLHTVEARDMT